MALGNKLMALFVSCKIQVSFILKCLRHIRPYEWPFHLKESGKPTGRPKILPPVELQPMRDLPENRVDILDLK